MPYSQNTEHWSVPRQRAMHILALAFILGMVVGMAAMVVMFRGLTA
jgi:hypothetical protein